MNKTVPAGQQRGTGPRQGQVPTMAYGAPDTDALHMAGPVGVEPGTPRRLRTHTHHLWRPLTPPGAQKLPTRTPASRVSGSSACRWFLGIGLLAQN